MAIVRQQRGRPAGAITQPELLDMPNQSAPPTHGEPSAARRGLAALKAEQQEAADAVPFSDTEIAGWLERNITALAEEHAGVIGALKKRRAAMRGARPDDQRWPRYWELRGREQYVEESIRAVNVAGKPAVCLTHGVAGIDELAAEHYEGAFHHEALLPRYCSACVRDTNIRTYARRLQEASQ